ncbi:hypothetical protein B0T18DRAFT_492431 [Schizothecium vesticola]|uniref:F-box domain-containing protein n=1 Tax=Schizothecium vesticola TaxID=314040 RepID=A0AA40EHL8_9PEZI|nr:hypothetical protein B0T18DRAFT_492431 [Schizothecium vesticola]
MSNGYLGGRNLFCCLAVCPLLVADGGSFLQPLIFQLLSCQKHRPRSKRIVAQPQISSFWWRLGPHILLQRVSKKLPPPTLLLKHPTWATRMTAGTQNIYQIMKLPLDIWLLTLQDMATEGDLEGLFHVAQTSRTLAHFALQLLYEHLPSTGSGDGASVIIRSMWWRSVIMSILGQTSQPYYAFVKVLSLFSLYCHLLDFNSTTQVRLSGCTGPELRDAFFSYPLQAVKIQDGKGRLDAGAVVVQVANLLSKRLQATGAAHDDATTLSVLERTNLPTGNWPEWASRPARLTSLSVRPIDSLSGDLARAIRKACPRFKELEWRDSSEFSSDKTAGEFIQNLAPNSLVSFQVFWNISVGPEIIQALGSQIMSLRHLGLPRLQNPALEALPLVGPLVGLKSFKLGFGWELPSMVPAGDIRQTIISWMKQQVSLKEFELEYYEETIEFVQELLGGLEKTKLESLTICQDYGSIASLSSQDQIRLYDEVGKQTALRSLCLSDDYEVLEEEDYPAVLDETQPQQLALANALALLTELRSLKISSPMSYRAFTSLSFRTARKTAGKTAGNTAPSGSKT